MKHHGHHHSEIPGIRPIHALLLTSILLLAALFRCTGVNWDSGAHLHPDERFLTMVTTALDWPQSVNEYFDTRVSPLNPHNRGFSFFVYGTWPVHAVKFVAETLGQATYDGVPLVGRIMSAMADIFVTGIVFAIAAYTGTIRTGLFAAFFYAASVIPIQMSHFYTVDPYATLMLTILLWRLMWKKFGVVSGIFLGLAVAAKISSIYFISVVILGYVLAYPFRKSGAPQSPRAYLIHGILTCVFALVTLRIAYPYLFDGFIFNPMVLANWKQLGELTKPVSGFPPSLQWIGVPMWRPATDLIIWGLGLPQGLLTVTGLVIAIRSVLKHKLRSYPLIPLIFWPILSVIVLSTQFAKPLRYLLPAYPALAVLAGIAADQILQKIGSTKRRYIAGSALVILVLIWPVSFLSVYRNQNTRVAANEWIYAHIPVGKSIAWEHWDDPLPFGTHHGTPGNYTQIQLNSFDPDDNEKREKIISVLKKSDYLILSSNRTYGAIMQSGRYPITSSFYRKLFDGSLGFSVAAVFTSRPHIPLPVPAYCIEVPGYTYGAVAKRADTCTGTGIFIVDDYAEETFTVYDHAKVIIFKKMNQTDINSYEF